MWQTRITFMRPFFFFLVQLFDIRNRKRCKQGRFVLCLKQTCSLGACWHALVCICNFHLIICAIFYILPMLGMGGNQSSNYAISSSREKGYVCPLVVCVLICVRMFRFTKHPEERERDSEKEGRRRVETTEMDRKQMDWKEKQDPWQRERGTD